MQIVCFLVPDSRDLKEFNIEQSILFYMSLKFLNTSRIRDQRSVSSIMYLVVFFEFQLKPKENFWLLNERKRKFS